MSSMDFFGVTEAARLIGITTSRLRQLLRAGDARGTKISKRAWVVPGDEITRLRDTTSKRGRPRSQSLEKKFRKTR